MTLMRWLRRSSCKVAFCTVATPDYLPMAAVLIDSIRAAYGLRCDIHVLIVANERIRFEYGNAKVYYALDLPDTFYYWDMVLRYDIACRACALKPMFARHINSLRRYDALFYLDADMELFGRLVEAEKLVCDPAVSILLSPHSMEPRFLGRPIDDRSFLSSGTFNAGLFGVDASEQAFAFLSWWWRLNQTECGYDTVHLSRDQKWLNLAPAYFDRLRILRHPGYNVAHFNYDERRAVLTNGDLRLFHYTMLHQYQWDVKTYLERHQLKNDPNLVRTLTRYAKLVRDKELELEAQFAITAVVSEGDISPALREAYRRMFPDPNPPLARGGKENQRAPTCAPPQTKIIFNPPPQRGAHIKSLCLVEGGKDKPRRNLLLPVPVPTLTNLSRFPPPSLQIV